MKSKIILRSLIGAFLILTSVYLCTACENVDSEKIAIAFEYPSSESNSASIANFGKFLNRENEIIFAMSDENRMITGIYRSEIDGSNITKISDIVATYLSEHDGFLYFRDVDAHKIAKMHFDGTGYEAIVEATGYIIDPSNGDLYYADYFTRNPVRCLKSSGEDVEALPVFASDFQIHKGFLYFQHGLDNTLYRMNLTDGSYNQISNQPISKYVITSEAIYFNNVGLYHINLSDLSENELIKSTTEEETVINFTINDGWIYYLTMESRGISILNRMHIDRSEKSILLRSDKFMPLNTHLFISGDNLYLTGYYETEQLMKIDFDALEPVVVDLLPLN